MSRKILLDLFSRLHRVMILPSDLYQIMWRWRLFYLKGKTSLISSVLISLKLYFVFLLGICARLMRVWNCWFLICKLFNFILPRLYDNVVLFYHRNERSHKSTLTSSGNKSNSGSRDRKDDDFPFDRFRKCLYEYRRRKQFLGKCTTFTIYFLWLWLL